MVKIWAFMQLHICGKRFLVVVMLAHLQLHNNYGMHIMTDLLHFLTSRLLEGGPSQLLNNFRVRTPYVGPASIRTTTLDYLMIFYRLVCLRFTIKKNININIVMSGSRVNERPEAIADRKTLNITKVLFKTKPSDKKSDPPSSKISLLTPSDSPDQFSTLQPIPDSKVANKSRNFMPIQKGQNLHKLNALRNLNSQSKQEIINLKARINKLKQESERNRKRSLQSYAQIEKMLSTKYNYIEKKRNKSLQDEKKMHEQLNLIETTQLARLQNKQATKSSRAKCQLDKSTMGLTQRQIWTLESQTLKQEKKRRQEMNAQRANNIKEYEKQHRNYLSIINQLSRVKARSNHQEKVKSYIKQKQILNKTMMALKEEEIALFNSLKKESQDLRNIQEQIEQLKIRSGKQHSPNRIS